MRKILEMLYDLQELDNQEEEIRKDPLVKTLTQTIGELEEHLSQLEETQAGLQGEIREKNRHIKRMDHEEQSMGVRRKELEEEMYSGRVGAKELSQIQKKMNQLQVQKEALGDELLERLEEVEVLEGKEAELQNRLASVEKKKEGKKRDLNQRQEENGERKEQLKKEKETLVNQMGEKYLAIYQEVKENRGGVAVVPVKESYCQGCRVELPATTIDKLYGSDELVYCESCGRILFLKKG